MKKKKKKYLVTYYLYGPGSVEVTASSKKDARDKFDWVPDAEIIANTRYTIDIDDDGIELLSDDK
jgi:hypothetical protein